jgi:hypothetical protein
MLDVPETGEGNSLIFFRNCKVFWFFSKLSNFLIFFSKL